MQRRRLSAQGLDQGLDVSALGQLLAPGNVAGARYGPAGLATLDRAAD